MRHPLFVKLLLLALAGAVIPTATGCHKATFVDPAYPTAHKAPPVEAWTHFYLFGLVGEQNIDVRQVCQGEAALVRTGGNVGTDVLAVVTLGIYTPRKVYVTCASPQAPALDPADRTHAGNGAMARAAGKEHAQ